MLMLDSFLKGKSKSADNLKHAIDDRDDPGRPSELNVQDIPTLLVEPPRSPLDRPRKSLPENKYYAFPRGNHGGTIQRRESFDVEVSPERRSSVIGALINLITPPAMKRTDQKSGGSTKGTSKLMISGRASPQMSKKSLLASSQESGSQSLAASVSGSATTSDDNATTPGASSEDLMLDNGSDPGIDDVDSGDSSARTRQVIETIQAKIHKTKEAIKREQNTKEAIVNEYLQMASEKQPTARIKTLFEKKNQKSAQNIIHLQRKLENYQHRLADIETFGYTGHKQAKEVLRDVGQGINTIVSKPKEFAHLIKNKFGSADNITQLSKFYVELDDSAPLESSTNGRPGEVLLSSLKCTSDDEASSATSGSGPRATRFSPHHSARTDMQLIGLNPAMLLPITDEINTMRDSSRKANEIIMKLAEEFEDYKTHMQTEVSVLRSQLEDEKFRFERLEEQLNDLTELHQHEMQNLKQDMTSMEEKIDYRLDERTTDLSDLVDSASTRISRLEQQQQQQQILSMEMVENATFRTIISKLINVVLALLAVVLVFVSTGANFLAPFVNSTSRLLISLATVTFSWLVYHNYDSIEGTAQSIWGFLIRPWS